MFWRYSGLRRLYYEYLVSMQVYRTYIHYLGNGAYLQVVLCIYIIILGLLVSLCQQFLTQYLQSQSFKILYTYLPIFLYQVLIEIEREIRKEKKDGTRQVHEFQDSFLKVCLIVIGIRIYLLDFIRQYYINYEPALFSKSAMTCTYLQGY